MITAGLFCLYVWTGRPQMWTYAPAHQCESYCLVRSQDEWVSDTTKLPLRKAHAPWSCYVRGTP